MTIHAVEKHLRAVEKLWIRSKLKYAKSNMCTDFSFAFRDEMQYEIINYKLWNARHEEKSAIIYNHYFLIILHIIYFILIMTSLFSHLTDDSILFYLYPRE